MTCVVGCGPVDPVDPVEDVAAPIYNDIHIYKYIIYIIYINPMNTYMNTRG